MGNEEIWVAHADQYGNKELFLTYDTSSPADTSTISNSAQYLIDNQPQLIWEKYGGSTRTKNRSNV